MSSQRQVRLPVGLVSDRQAGESSAIIIHNIVGSVCRANNLQETKHEASNSGGKQTRGAELQPPHLISSYIKIKMMLHCRFNLS